MSKIKQETLALTDEQRERLIEVATKRLGQYQSMKQAQEGAAVRPRGGIEFDYQLSIDLMQIALAALTAETVYQFIVNNPDNDGYIEWADCNPDFYSKEPSDRRRILYTAPPVPALKLPDEIRLHGDMDEAAVFHWNAAIAEVKSLNGVTE